ncbi:MAG: hypothetical protein ACJ8AW_06945, partial [Rhodopila sp.]
SHRCAPAVAACNHDTGYGGDGMTDTIIRRIERFSFPPGAVRIDRRNRGYTLTYAADPDGEPVEVLYWSLHTDRWSSTGPFGRTTLPLDQALRFIAAETIFWALI